MGIKTRKYTTVVSFLVVDHVDNTIYSHWWCRAQISLMLHVLNVPIWFWWGILWSCCSVILGCRPSALTELLTPVCGLSPAGLEQISVCVSQRCHSSECAAGLQQQESGRGGGGGRAGAECNSSLFILQVYFWGLFVRTPLTSARLQGWCMELLVITKPC